MCIFAHHVQHPSDLATRRAGRREFENQTLRLLHIDMKHAHKRARYSGKMLKPIGVR